MVRSPKLSWETWGHVIRAGPLRWEAMALITRTGRAQHGRTVTEKGEQHELRWAGETTASWINTKLGVPRQGKGPKEERPKAALVCARGSQGQH